LLQVLGITIWGVGNIPCDIHRWIENDEDVASIIHTTQHGYAKKVQMAWDAKHWEWESNRATWATESKRLMQWWIFMSPRWSWQVCLQHSFVYYYLLVWFVVFKLVDYEKCLWFWLQGTSKEDFAAAVVRLQMEHHHVYTHQLIPNAKSVVATAYRQTHGIIHWG
jgi:hypothetical protein